MNCLRCGRETSGQQVFCDACLDLILGASTNAMDTQHNAANIATIRGIQLARNSHRSTGYQQIFFQVYHPLFRKIWIILPDFLSFFKGLVLYET